jgi:hypothetical protein
VLKIDFTARFARAAEDAEVTFILFSGERPENSEYRSLREKVLAVHFLSVRIDMYRFPPSRGNDTSAFSAARAKRAVKISFIVK